MRLNKLDGYEETRFKKHSVNYWKSKFFVVVCDIINARDRLELATLIEKKFPRFLPFL